MVRKVYQSKKSFVTGLLVVLIVNKPDQLLVFILFSVDQSMEILRDTFTLSHLLERKF